MPQPVIALAPPPAAAVGMPTQPVPGLFAHAAQNQSFAGMLLLLNANGSPPGGLIDQPGLGIAALPTADANPAQNAQPPTMDSPGATLASARAALPSSAALPSAADSGPLIGQPPPLPDLLSLPPLLPPAPVSEQTPATAPAAPTRAAGQSRRSAAAETVPAAVAIAAAAALAPPPAPPAPIPAADDPIAAPIPAAVRRPPTGLRLPAAPADSATALDGPGDSARSTVPASVSADPAQPPQRPAQATLPPPLAAVPAAIASEAVALTQQSTQHVADTPATAAPPASVAPAAAAPASPAAQVAPALMSLAHAPDGAQRLTLRLQPPDLGQVQVRIDRPLEAPVRVEITVQRPETLNLLLRDQPQLQRALDQAGVPAEGRTLTFQLSPQPGPSLHGVHGMTVMTGGAGDGASRGGTGREPASPQSSAPGDDEPLPDDLPVAPRWLRAGLDITA